MDNIADIWQFVLENYIWVRAILSSLLVFQIATLIIIRAYEIDKNKSERNLHLEETRVYNYGKKSQI